MARAASPDTSLEASRSGMLALALLVAVLGCSRAPDPAPSLDLLLARGEYESVVEAAGPELLAAHQRGASAAECWALERARLVALARLGRSEQLIEAWQAAQQHYTHLVTARFVSELALQLSAADPTGLGAKQFLRSALRPQVAGPISPDSLERLLRSNPYGHPEGFPKAWLAPDERPESRGQP